MPEWVAQTIVIATAALLLILRRKLRTKHVCSTCRNKDLHGTEEPCWSCSIHYPHLSAWEPQEKDQ